MGIESHCEGPVKMLNKPVGLQMVSRGQVMLHTMKVSIGSQKGQGELRKYIMQCGTPNLVFYSVIKAWAKKSGSTRDQNDFWPTSLPVDTS